MASQQRPLSPFMLGPYYRPQLTSVLSILHRITGVALALVAFVLPCWLWALSSGPQDLAWFYACAASVPGRLLIAAVVFSLCYHFFNGLRHLLWDTGWGFELKQAYATGWAAVVLAVLSTGLICAFGFGWIGGGA